MKKDHLESLFHEFKQMELKEENLRLLQGGTDGAGTASQSRTGGDTCGGQPCCQETALKDDCCTNQDTGALPLSDCDPGGQIGDVCF